MRISEQQIRAALEKSGYLIEDRTNRLLESKKWSTSPNSRYKDLKNDIEREIDIIAFNNILNHQNTTDITNSTLVIECMNNEQPIVFFNNLKPTPSRTAGLSFHSIPDKFYDILYWAQNEIDSSNEIVHSSQYCSFKQVDKLKKVINDGWIALHPDDKHGSIDSLFDYIKYRKYEFKEFNAFNLHINGFYYRPIVVLQGELLVVSQKEKLIINGQKHIKYQIPKTDNNGRYFIVDVVTESYFSEYLDLIEYEDKEIAKMILKHRDKLIKKNII